MKIISSYISQSSMDLLYLFFKFYYIFSFDILLSFLIFLYFLLTCFCNLFNLFSIFLTTLLLFIFLNTVPSEHIARSFNPNSIPNDTSVKSSLISSCYIPTEIYQYLLSYDIRGLLYLTPIGNCSLVFIQPTFSILTNLPSLTFSFILSL